MFADASNVRGHKNLKLSGNLLDLVVLPPVDGNNARIMVSLDTIHDPLSVSRPTRVKDPLHFEEWKCHINHWSKTNELTDLLNETMTEKPDIAASLDPEEAGLVVDEQPQDLQQAQDQSTDLAANGKKGRKQKQKPKQKQPNQARRAHGQKLRTQVIGKDSTTTNVPYYSTIGEFLYGLENLRKNRGKEAMEADPDTTAVNEARDENELV